MNKPTPMMTVPEMRKLLADNPEMGTSPACIFGRREVSFLLDEIAALSAQLADAERRDDEYEAALNSAMGNTDKSDGSALRAVRRLVQAYLDAVGRLPAPISHRDVMAILGMPEQRPTVAESLDQMARDARERGCGLMEPRA